MTEQAVIRHSEPGTDLATIVAPGTSLLAAVRGRPAAEVRAVVADLRAELAQFLEREPDSYDALVLLGELDLRVGLCHEARALLYRASLQQPPSWEAFQRTGVMLRRAEEQCNKAFNRLPGIPPPWFLRGLASRGARRLAPVIHKLMIHRSKEVCA